MMKNKYLFLVMLLGGSLFMACSDSDDKSSPKDFNGTYSQADADRSLDLKYSNSVLTGKSVEFNSADGSKATLKLQGVVPGEKETVFSGIELVPNKSVYSFTAEDKNDVRGVSLNGTIEKGKLTLGVNVTFAQNGLSGVWNTPSVNMTWKPHDYVLTTINMMILGKPISMDLTTGLLSAFAPGMLGKELKNYLQDVSFRADGNIVATYNAAKATDDVPEPVANWQQSPLNLAHYLVKDGICYVYLNIDMIMRQVQMDNSGRSTGGSSLEAVLEQLLGDGIPVHFGVESGKLMVYLDEVLLKQLGPIIPLVSGLIPADAAFDYNGTSVEIKPIVDKLPDALDATTEMKVGLNFVAAE